ncbi:MAG: hypothetical protein ACRYFR_01010 [Janthinobacterium lividum]
MQLSKLSSGWLFQRHSEQTIKRWVQRLEYFYFVRAWGGHANDGDAFKARFSYADAQDLLHKLGQLGVTLSVIPEGFPRPVVGKKYSAAAYDRFKSEIQRFKNYEQPGHVLVAKHEAFIWVSDDEFEISVAGTKDHNRYEVTEDDFTACVALEKVFHGLGWRNTGNEKVAKSICWLSRATYPELYEA